MSAIRVIILRANQHCLRRWILLSVLLVMSSCGDDNGGSVEPEPTAAELTNDGWIGFEAGDFNEAIASFESALTTDNTFFEAENGLGWSWLRLDTLQLALTRFDSAIAKGFVGPDPHAGQAVAYRDLEPVDFGFAIAAAESALSHDARYEFSHDTVFDWRDLRLIMAQSHFGLQQYEEANAQVDSLDGNPLDPISATFVGDLLAEIERLGDEVAGE